MNFQIIFLESAAWSLLWIIMVAISVRIFPFTIEHDYPEAARKVAKLPELTGKHKRNGAIFGVISFVILFGLLIAFAVLMYRGKELLFFRIFIHLWIVCMTWNVVDLVIVDWLLICLLRIKYFVLPGTEDCEGNKDYKFHFIGFLKGIFAMTIVAVLFSGISYFMLRVSKV